MADQNVVCLIEDNASIRKLFSILLKKRNYTIVEFEEGIPAVNWLSKNVPYAVICDDILPDVNGSELIKTVRSFPNGRDLCMIAVTGYAHESDRDRYVRLGFDGYIPKPINTGSFVDQIVEIASTRK